MRIARKKPFVTLFSSVEKYDYMGSFGNCGVHPKQYYWRMLRTSASQNISVIIAWQKLNDENSRIKRRALLRLTYKSAMITLIHLRN